MVDGGWVLWQGCNPRQTPHSHATFPDENATQFSSQGSLPKPPFPSPGTEQLKSLLHLLYAAVTYPLICSPPPTHLQSKWVCVLLVQDLLVLQYVFGGAKYTSAAAVCEKADGLAWCKGGHRHAPIGLTCQVEAICIYFSLQEPKATPKFESGLGLTQAPTSHCSAVHVLCLLSAHNPFWHPSFACQRNNLTNCIIRTKVVQARLIWKG